MYRLLIVDDEPFILDGLCDLFESGESRFDVYRASGADEALSLLSKARMDIVITDICMTGIDGLELISRIKEQWSICRVLLLTGINDFSYIQRAMNLGADAYVLKSQGDEAIIEAVEKSVCLLEKDSTDAAWREHAEAAIKAALPAMRNDYLLGLLHEDPACLSSIVSDFRDLEIPLDADSPVFFVGARLDLSEKEDRSAISASRLLAGLDAVFLANIEGKAVCASANWGRRYQLWLIQGTLGTTLGNTARYIGEMLERIQERCCDRLSASVSFVLDQSPVGLYDAAASFERMRSLLIYRIGVDTQMLIGNSDYFGVHSDTSYLLQSQQDVALKDMSLALQHGNQELFMQRMQQLVENVCRENRRDLTLECYHRLSAILLSYLRESDCIGSYVAEFGDLGLFVQPNTEHPDEAFAPFLRAADWILATHRSNAINHNTQLISRLHTYIEEHLTEDLSLVALGEAVYLSPVYLSRIYKQITGNRLSEYVLLRRIERAKPLLADRGLKIAEIATNVGFESAAHFSRIFRKVVGNSPQEYRAVVDPLKGI